MQTYLTDLSTTRRDTPSFIICQRVLLKAQNIIFSDPPLQSNAPYRSTPTHTILSRFWKRKVKPRIGPALIGMSAALAGAPGLPQVASTTGRVAIEQGRVPLDEKRSPRPFQAGEEDETVGGMSPSSSILLQKPDEPDPDSDEEDGTINESEEEDVNTFGQSTMPKLNVPVNATRTPLPAPPSPEAAGQSSVPRRRTIGPSRTSPSLVRSRFRSQVLDQRSSSPSASTPSLHRSMTLGSSPTQDDILQRIDPLVAGELLRGHYCRSEVQFLLALESISNRLLVVPKLAVRVSSP